MCMYKIHYEIKDGENRIKHSRYYHATNEAIAKEMLEETWRDGSLIGYSHPKIIRITEIHSRETNSN